MNRVHEYMFPEQEQKYVTESYVSSPPAARVTDERNDVFTLGYVYQVQRDSPRGEYAFNVLRNGCDTGEYASRIERRNGKVRIFTRNGWKVWNFRSFV
jgi:hypothetical protein